MKSAGSADVWKSRPLMRNSAGKLTGPVEDVIAWAWRDELPKFPKARPSGPASYGNAWNKTARYAEYMSLVELYGVNQYGCVPDFSASEWPHPDAVTVAEAVQALDDAVLEMPEHWQPAPELDEFGGLAVKVVSVAWRTMTRNDLAGGTVLRTKPSDLVIYRAVMGSDMGGMAIEGVEQKFEASANGQERWFVRRIVDTIVGVNPDGSDRTEPREVEMDGRSPKTHRPTPGAYRKPYLDPDPIDAIVARAEHEIWLSCLAMVAEACADSLTEVVMLPTRLPVAPWIDRGRRSRVLPDLIADAATEAEARGMREAAFAARYPRWFKALRKMAEKMNPSPA